MSKISIIMPVYNAEEYIFDAIESVMKQSFIDFDLIIVDDGSTDNTKKIIRSFRDKRILFFQNNHNFIESLNLGLQKASGKYIARMDADDVMHIDRLMIQYNIMEEEPEITVCGSWMIPFGEEKKGGALSKSLNGIIEYPLLELLKGNFIFHPTVIVRKDFLETHNLSYQNYDYAEDYKLWYEIAKRKGVFYIESQPLLYYRLSRNQITQSKESEQIITSENIQNEILEYLIGNNRLEEPLLETIYNNFKSLIDEQLICKEDSFSFYYKLFLKNRNKFNLL